MLLDVVFLHVCSDMRLLPEVVHVVTCETRVTHIYAAYACMTTGDMDIVRMIDYQALGLSLSLSLSSSSSWYRINRRL